MLNAFKKQSHALISELDVPVAPVALTPVKRCEPVVQPLCLSEGMSLPEGMSLRGTSTLADLQTSSWERSAWQPGRHRGGRRWPPCFSFSWARGGVRPRAGQSGVVLTGCRCGEKDKKGHSGTVSPAEAGRSWRSSPLRCQL